MSRQTAPARRASDRAPRRAWHRLSQWVVVGAALFAASSLVWRVSRGEVVHDGAPNWSPDGRTIVFSAEQGDQTDIYVMDADGTSRRQLTATPSEDNAPAFSPDGSMIAFESNRDGNFEIYVMDASGRNVRRLTTQPGDDRAPAWSPDGAQLAFISDRGHANRFDLYLMGTDGSGLRRVDGDRPIWSSQFSPDGRLLALQAGEDIELVDAAGSGTARRLTSAPANGMAPTWSPDGRALAFTSTRNGRAELFRMNPDGSDQSLLVSMAGGSAIDPRWSPDGSRIAFVYVPDAGHDDVPVPAYAIYTVDVATSEVRRISP